MAQYFAISQQAKLWQTIQEPFNLSDACPFIIGDNLIYANLIERCLIIKKLNLSMDSKSKESRVNKVQIPRQLQKQKITHIINLNENYEANQKQTNKLKQYYLLLVTYTKICMISLNKTFTAITTYDCFHLIIQPHLNTAQIRHRVTNVYKLLNQQILHIEGQSKILLAGFDKNRKIRVNSYLYCLQGKPNLKLIAQCHLEYAKQTQKNYYNYAFTISQPQPNYPIIYVHATVNQKGLALKLYKYNLHNMLNTADPQNGQIQAEQVVHQLFCIHNYIHVRSVYQEGSDIYICYTKYVPFAAHHNTDKDVKQKMNNIFSHVWIYSLNIGYTRNIIEIDGFILASTVYKPKVKVTNKQQNVKTLVIITKDLPGQLVYKKVWHKTLFINMDSSKYHPLFQINTEGFPLLLNERKFVISQILQQGQKQPKHKIIIHNKINKGFLYCKIWHSIGTLGSQNLLFQTLNLLQIL